MSWHPCFLETSATSNHTLSHLTAKTNSRHKTSSGTQKPAAVPVNQQQSSSSRQKPLEKRRSQQQQADASPNEHPITQPHCATTRRTHAFNLATTTYRILCKSSHYKSCSWLPHPPAPFAHASGVAALQQQIHLSHTPHPTIF